MKPFDPTRKEQMQRDPSNSFIAGSFTDRRSYALKKTMADGNKDQHDPPTRVTPQLKYFDQSDILPVGVNGAIASINTLAEELLHANEMSITESLTESHRSIDSAVRVEITDTGADSYNFTTSTLRKCKLQILKPYWGLLIFIGWRRFRHDIVSPCSVKTRLLNALYPSAIVLLLLYTYMYEMVACEWRLNIVKDIALGTTVKTTVIPPNHTTERIPWDSATSRSKFNLSSTIAAPQACQHIVTTYLIPNILHFVAYVMGIYYFRIQDNEQMYALMEKVFLQADPLQTGSSSQHRLVTKIRIFLGFGSVWVLITLLLQVLYVWAFNFPPLGILEYLGPEFHWTTFGVELLGRVILNFVILAVVVNYTIQCEMVMFYVRRLTTKLQEKSMEIKDAFKDILLLRQSLGLLNGTISKMTTLVMVILAELTIIGISILAVNEYNDLKVWLYRGIFPIVWASMLGVPLFQAARVNYLCLRLKKIALEIRVFGYKNSSQLELDSFLQFVHFTKLRAKLFHVAILPSYIISFTTLASFIFLILIQTSSLEPKDFIV